MMFFCHQYIDGTPIFRQDQTDKRGFLRPKNAPQPGKT